MNWPPTPFELEEAEIQAHIWEIPPDHAAVLLAVRHPTWHPYVNEIATDAGLSYDITRSCLRNLKYKQLVRLVTMTREDYLGYYGCCYDVTSMGRVVADRLERMGHPWPNGDRRPRYKPSSV